MVETAPSGALSAWGRELRPGEAVELLVGSVWMRGRVARDVRRGWCVALDGAAGVVPLAPGMVVRHPG